jgi:cytochrome c biogenesis protein CcmG/thiol:disulfide interchange protein DsbE
MQLGRRLGFSSASSETGAAVRAFRIIIRVVGVTALLALLTITLLGGGHPLDVGDRAPATHGPSIDGMAFDLAGWQGHVVVVNVWASWCPPCLRELPDFADAARRWDQHDVRFVGLTVDSPPEKVRQMAERFQLPYPVVPIDEATQRAWKATSLPSTFILRPDGTVAWSVRGAIGGRELDDALQDITR